MFDFEKYINETSAWQKDTFGPGERTEGVLAHIRKELKEVEDQPYDVYEWADLIILAIDGATRAGHQPDALCYALQDKLDRNRNRTWPDWRTIDRTKPIEHIKENA